MDPLNDLCQHPDVQAASATARTACENLRWHPALRKRTAEVATEVRVHCAQASATIEGANLPINVVRTISMGQAPPSDAVGQLTHASVRAYAHVEHLARNGGKLLRTTPQQALATLHTTIGVGLYPEHTLGRPRRDGENVADPTHGIPIPTTNDPHRLTNLWALLRSPENTPALVIAALAWAEIQTSHIFPCANGLHSRATFRAITVARGLDPYAVCAPEPALAANPTTYLNALQAYTTGTLTGVLTWITYCATLIEQGCEAGHNIADAVLAGTFPGDN